MHCKNPTKMKTAKERAATKNRRESKSNAVAFLADAQFLFLVDIVLIRCTSDVWRFGTFFSSWWQSLLWQGGRDAWNCNWFWHPFSFWTIVRSPALRRITTTYGASVDVVRWDWWSNWIGKYKSSCKRWEDNSTVLHSSWVHCAVGREIYHRFFRKHFVYYCFFVAQLVGRKSTLTNAQQRQLYDA